ncbi:TPA: hypothetical protein ACNIGA_005184 [Klebsiella variicola]
MTDITELTSVQKNANIHRLSRLIAYASNDELRQMAVEVEHYTDQLIEALEKAHAVMNAVVTAAAIRGVRPFDGIDCDPPTLEENAEACGDAMSARIRELEANPPKPHHNGLMQISNELASAKQRIAELESRTVKIPYLPDDCDRTEAHYKYQAALRDAAIKVEADSLDADGSNINQPGMVVAVHIDVGDFVKFRGQVYEVKETDFDDHDVTLWFVCGEVLKCSAGCPIEVVSAPVENE